MQKGDEFQYKGGTARVMAVADNWVMARKKGCIPFTILQKRAAQLLREADKSIPKPSCKSCMFRSKCTYTAFGSECEDYERASP